MVPRDFRLESVAARLVERLEGTRRTYADAKAANEAFSQAASDMVAEASAEYADLGVDPLADAQKALLEREIRDTFLPRYTRIATEMTTREQRRFGLGPLAEPLGRIATFVVALFVVVFGLKFAFEFRPLFALLPVLLATPLLPDVASILANRRYERELQVLVDDMAKIQEQARAYEGGLRREKPGESTAPRPRREKETQ
jgi:hypothetical protein